MDTPSYTGDEIGEDIEKRIIGKEMILMNTTAVRARIHERIDPVLEAMITRELARQSASPQAIPGALQQPGAPFAALAPALIAILVSQQPQQVPIQQPQLPLATLLPILVAILADQTQQVPVQRPGSPLATLLPVLVAILAGQQRQPTRPSPLVTALSAALAPVITSALTGRPRGEKEEHKQAEGEPEEKHKQAGEGTERAGQ